MMKKTLLSVFALLTLLTVQADDVLVLRFKGGATVCWLSETKPVVLPDGDSIMVQGATYNVRYANRLVDRFYLADSDGVNQVKGDDQTITIDGRTINFAGKATLYNLSGQKVASGKGRITVPQAGVYVLQMGKKSIKLMVP